LGTTFLLIRHALHEFGGHRIAGRTPDVHLSPDGVAQAAALAGRVAKLPLDALYASPLTRTQETARAIADRVGIEPVTAPEIVEVDFGAWTGANLDDLRLQDGWKQFNAFRSGARAPGGELMPEIQLRIVNFMLELCTRHPAQTVALVSHGDVIKSAIAYFLGVPLDLFHRIEISPASISVVQIAEYGPWVLGVNSTGELPELPYQP